MKIGNKDYHNTQVSWQELYNQTSLEDLELHLKSLDLHYSDALINSIHKLLWSMWIPGGKFLPDDIEIVMPNIEKAEVKLYSSFEVACVNGVFSFVDKDTGTYYDKLLAIYPKRIEKDAEFEYYYEEVCE